MECSDLYGDLRGERAFSINWRRSFLMENFICYDWFF